MLNLIQLKTIEFSLQVSKMFDICLQVHSISVSSVNLVFLLITLSSSKDYPSIKRKSLPNHLLMANFVENCFIYYEHLVNLLLNFVNKLVVKSATLAILRFPITIHWNLVYLAQVDIIYVTQLIPISASRMRLCAK